MKKRKGKLHWEKSFTREYSFLYVDYVISAFEIMENLVGTTSRYSIFLSKKNLVTKYRMKEDSQSSYNFIRKIAVSEPDRIIKHMDVFDEFIQRDYQLIKNIDNAKSKEAVKQFFTELDEMFLKTLCYYTFFVHVGNSADTPEISAFLKKHGDRFYKIRKYTIDTDVDSVFPMLYGKYDRTLGKWCKFMSRKEIKHFIDTDNYDFASIQYRKERYLLVMRDGKVTEYRDEDFDKTVEKELSHIKDDRETNQVRGTSVCSGKVTGMVKVVFTVKDFSKVKDGDVLVTPMTKPNMMPFLTRVSGIITNDGGVLSHASIIAREMDIPCIVGTTYATDIFKDGDRVELDADKGIIKKLG